MLPPQMKGFIWRMRHRWKQYYPGLYLSLLGYLYNRLSLWVQCCILLSMILQQSKSKAIMRLLKFKKWLHQDILLMIFFFRVASFTTFKFIAGKTFFLRLNLAHYISAYHQRPEENAKTGLIWLKGSSKLNNLLLQ